MFVPVKSAFIVSQILLNANDTSTFHAMENNCILHQSCSGILGKSPEFPNPPIPQHQRTRAQKCRLHFLRYATHCNYPHGIQIQHVSNAEVQKANKSMPSEFFLYK